MFYEKLDFFCCGFFFVQFKKRKSLQIMDLSNIELNVFRGRKHSVLFPLQITSTMVTALQMVAFIGAQFKNALICLFMFNEAIPDFIL